METLPHRTEASPPPLLWDFGTKGKLRHGEEGTCSRSLMVHKHRGKRFCSAHPAGRIPQSTGQQPSHPPLENTSLPGLKDSTSSSKPDGMISTPSEREQLPQNTDYANTLVTKMMFPEF